VPPSFERLKSFTVTPLLTFSCRTILNPRKKIVCETSVECWKNWSTRTELISLFTFPMKIVFRDNRHYVVFALLPSIRLVWCARVVRVRVRRSYILLRIFDLFNVYGQCPFFSSARKRHHNRLRRTTHDYLTISSHMTRETNSLLRLQSFATSFRRLLEIRESRSDHAPDVNVRKDKAANHLVNINRPKLIR